MFVKVCNIIIFFVFWYIKRFLEYQILFIDLLENKQHKNNDDIISNNKNTDFFKFFLNPYKITKNVWAFWVHYGK